jgi:hypothetical protein
VLLDKDKPRQQGKTRITERRDNTTEDEKTETIKLGESDQKKIGETSSAEKGVVLRKKRIQKKE